MANKICNVLAAIETKLLTLKTSGVLKGVERRLINNKTVASVPAVSLVLSDFGRKKTGDWIAVVDIRVVERSSDGTEDDLVDIVAQVQGAIDALRDAGTAGGIINRPIWETWHNAGGNKGENMVAEARLEITVEDPLLISA